MPTNNFFVLIQCAVWLTVSLFSLSGCASKNGDFTCPMAPGHLCSSLDEVNTMVDQGRVGGSNSSIASAATVAQMAAADVTGYPIGTMQPGDPLRYGESVQRIWIAPYEDQDGNYHQANTVYSIAQPGHWLGSPPRATEDGDN